MTGITPHIRGRKYEIRTPAIPRSFTSGMERMNGGLLSSNSKSSSLELKFSWPFCVGSLVAFGSVVDGSECSDIVGNLQSRCMRAQIDENAVQN